MNDSSAARFCNFVLRTDLPRAQAQVLAAACETMSRRANHSTPVQPFAQKYPA